MQFVLASSAITSWREMTQIIAQFASFHAVKYGKSYDDLPYFILPFIVNHITAPN